MDDKCDNESSYFIGIVLYSFVYMFIRSYITIKQKYPLNIDSYYYLNIAKTGISHENTLLSFLMKNFGVGFTQFFHECILFFILIIFYFLCRKFVNPEIASITTILFSISPIFIFNTNLGVFDKNIMTIFCIIIFLFITCTEMKFFIKTPLLILLLILFGFIWQGFLIIILLIFAFDMNECFNSKNYKMIWFSIILFLIILSGLLYKYFYYFINADLISETRSAIFSGFFEIYLFIFIAGMYIYYIKQKRLLIPLILSLIMCLCFFRLVIFTIPIIYLCMAEIMEKAKINKEKMLLYIISFFIILSSLSALWVYDPEPIMNDCILESMNYINTQNTLCLAADWGRGHIYQYYTNKTVLFKAHYNLNQLNYLAFGNITHNCSILYTERDLLAIKYMINKTDNVMPNKLYIETLPSIELCAGYHIIK